MGEWRGVTRRTALIAGAAAATPMLSASAAPAPLWTAGPRLRDRVGAGLGLDVSLMPARAAALGMRLGRTELMWDWIELDRGRYTNTEDFDGCLAQFAANGIRPIIILAANNNRWAQRKDGPVTSPEGIAAYGRFATWATERYRRYNPIWELINEPNLPLFWKAEPEPALYTTLALEAGRAVLAVDPNATILVGSLSGVEAPARDFLTRCLDLGLGEIADAVSVHPYLGPPEKALPEYAATKALLARYQGRRGGLALLNSEWGAASHTFEDAAWYAAFTARIMLTDALAGLAGTIYYRVQDANGDDEYDNHYGLVRANGEPKGSARLIKTLLKEIGDATTVSPLATEPSVFALKATLPQGDKIVAWTLERPADTRIEGQRVRLDRTPRVLA